MFKNRSQQYHRMAKAIEFLAENARSHPSLASLAYAVNHSESHVQRAFTEWVGISPKQFLQSINRRSAKKLLRSSSVADAASRLGYSSESRLYDSFLRYESMTPGEYKKSGEGLVIKYGFAQSPFGECLLAWTARGICKISFLDFGQGDENHAQKQELVRTELFQEWSLASFQRDDSKAAKIVEDVFWFDDQSSKIKRPQLRLMVKGTTFQVQVWEALMAIPAGELVSYQDVASYLGKPSAVRAVASAIAKNPVAYVIPCHRVIRSTGEFNQYRWGAVRKASMILSEFSAES